MNIYESLRETENQLKLDVDRGNYPEWYRLIRILNFVNFYPNAEIYETAVTGSHHLVCSLPSSLKLRRINRDCKGRIYMSEVRMKVIGAGGDIIFWTGKGEFKLIKCKGKTIVKWLRRRVPDRKIDLRDVLRLPAKLKAYMHKKRHLRWWRKKSWKVKRGKEVKIDEV